jgi:hypothetical protein
MVAAQRRDFNGTDRAVHGMIALWIQRVLADEAARYRCPLSGSTPGYSRAPCPNAPPLARFVYGLLVCVRDL